MHQTLCLLKDSFYISITTLWLFTHISIIIDILSKSSIDKFLHCDWVANIYSVVGTIKLKTLAKFTRNFANEKICQVLCSRVHLDLFACVILNASFQCCGYCFFCCFIVCLDNLLFLTFTDTQNGISKSSTGEGFSLNQQIKGGGGSSIISHSWSVMLNFSSVSNTWFFFLGLTSCPAFIKASIEIDDGCTVSVGTSTSSFGVLLHDETTDSEMIVSDSYGLEHSSSSCSVLSSLNRTR